MRKLESLNKMLKTIDISIKIVFDTTNITPKAIETFTEEFLSKINKHVESSSFEYEVGEFYEGLNEK